MAPGSELNFSITGINDLNHTVTGKVRILLYDSCGNAAIVREQDVNIPALRERIIPVCINLPEQPGGCLLAAEFESQGREKTLSRRYIKLGELPEHKFFTINP